LFNAGPKGAPLRRHLLLLIAAGFLPLFLVAGLGIWLLFQEREHTAHERALEITRALATALDSELRMSISALQTLATSGLLDQGNMAAFDIAARRALAAQANWQIISLAGPDGVQLVNTVFEAGQPLPPGQLEAESFDAVTRTLRPAVGRLVDGRRGSAFPVRVPVVREGQLKYVLTAVVSPDSIRQMLDRQGVAKTWVVSVFDSTFTRVARSRDHLRYIGTQGSESLLRLLRKDVGEGTGMTDTLEGLRVFTAFSRVPTWGWSVTLGMPVAEAYAPAVRSVALVSLAFGLSLGFGILTASFLARRINQSMARLREAARDVGEGRRIESVLSEVMEIREVAQALGDAAARLERAGIERDHLLQREKEARDIAETANRAKDQFLAMLGHELRNPLAALSNAVHLIERTPSGEAGERRTLDVIRRQVAHLTRLTDDLLDVARVQMNKIELHVEPIDLSAVVENTLKVLATTHRTARHRVEAHLRHAWVMGDPVRLDQIAGNLLVNAVKYPPAGRLITVRVFEDAGCGVLEVEDEGEGLSPELARRVFDLFVQGERQIDRSQGGLGIGLTLVKSLAQLHGGEASVRSDGEGRGSCFTVRLPATDRRPNMRTGDAPQMQPLKILVVEDNADARETLVMLLECMGHRVISAGNGATALELAQQTRPRLALVDLGLPGMDGFEVARRLRESAGTDMLICALSGYGSIEDRTRTRAAGFDEHFVKPLDVSLLSRWVQKAAARAPAVG
jgi:signal transduction histidine kinase/CheY-like chemotaxis protein